MPALLESVLPTPKTCASDTFAVSDNTLLKLTKCTSVTDGLSDRTLPIAKAVSSVTPVESDGLSDINI